MEERSAVVALVVVFEDGLAVFAPPFVVVLRRGGGWGGVCGELNEEGCVFGLLLLLLVF